MYENTKEPQGKKKDNYHRDLSSIPSSYVKSWVWWHKFITPSTAVSDWQLTGPWPSIHGEFQGTCFKRGCMCGGCLRDDTQGCSLASIGTCMCMCTPHTYKKYIKLKIQKTCVCKFTHTHVPIHIYIYIQKR